MTQSAPPDVCVRIGGLEVVAGDALARLVTVGLGSCVGVALIDTRSGAVGLAHVFLPELPPSGAKVGSGAGTYAPTAVAELVQRMGHVGAAARLIAVLAGGATMFGGGRPGQDIGQRNIAAVTAALTKARVRVVASEVGGSHGRTLRVVGGRDAEVCVRQVGGVERIAWSITGTLSRHATTMAELRAA